MSRLCFKDGFIIDRYGAALGFLLSLKLHIVRNVRNIELWPIPCVMKYWRLDLSFKKKKKESSPPISVSIPKKLSISSWSLIRSKAKVLLGNCIRSLDYLCVNRLRQHISWWGGKFLLRRWSKILWWQRPVVLPTVQWWRWAKLSVVWWRCVELLKVSGNLIMTVVIDVRRYISWRGGNYYIGWRRCVALPDIWWMTDW